MGRYDVKPENFFPLFAGGFNTHMRLLRHKQPVKCWQPFSLRIGAQGCNVMYQQFKV